VFEFGGRARRSERHSKNKAHHLILVVGVGLATATGTLPDSAHQSRNGAVSLGSHIRTNSKGTPERKRDGDLRSPIWWTVVVYGGASVVTLIVYMMAATGKLRRIHDSTLHRLELAGGWPGALLGQWCFRYKLDNWRFQTVSWLIGVGHVAGWAAWPWICQVIDVVRQVTAAIFQLLLVQILLIIGCYIFFGKKWRAVAIGTAHLILMCWLLFHPEFPIRDHYSHLYGPSEPYFVPWTIVEDRKHE
jgi:uncharacterized membrane protein YsdA (DUF1294 family)